MQKWRDLPKYTRFKTDNDNDILAELQIQGKKSYYAHTGIKRNEESEKQAIVMPGIITIRLQSYHQNGPDSK